MGWCSGAEIMDAAVSAVSAVVEELLNGDSSSVVQRVFSNQLVDDTLRPFVQTIAEKLRDGDWDCVEEAEAFDRFPQEMLGYDDGRMVSWARDQLDMAVDDEDSKRVAKYAQMLQHYAEKVGN